jgi:hypothetical protein
MLQKAFQWVPTHYCRNNNQSTTYMTKFWKLQATIKTATTASVFQASGNQLYETVGLKSYGKESLSKGVNLTDNTGHLMTHFCKM